MQSTKAAFSIVASADGLADATRVLILAHCSRGAADKSYELQTRSGSSGRECAGEPAVKAVTSYTHRVPAAGRRGRSLYFQQPSCVTRETQDGTTD